MGLPLAPLFYVALPESPQSGLPAPVLIRIAPARAEWWLWKHGSDRSYGIARRFHKIAFEPRTNQTGLWYTAPLTDCAVIIVLPGSRPSGSEKHSPTKRLGFPQILRIFFCQGVDSPFEVEPNQ